MIIKITHKAGLEETVLIFNDVQTIQNVVVTEVEGKDMNEALQTWQTIFSGQNTVPTNQIIKMEVID